MTSTTGSRIQMYLDELGWSAVELSRRTLIHLPDLQDILSGETEPTYAQMMNIINKINTQYPADEHWSIYHDIADPFNKQSEGK